MISRRKIAAIVLFLLMSLLMFTFASPANELEPTTPITEEVEAEEPPETEEVEEVEEEPPAALPPAPAPTPAPAPAPAPVAETPEISISLGADNEYVIEVHSPIPEFSATATDQNDNQYDVDISHNIVNFTLGTYEVVFTVTEGDITVTETEPFLVVDTTPPEIVLEYGDIIIRKGHDFTDPGATASDNYDPDVNVLGVGDVDTDTKGEYVLTYNHTDTSGNEAAEVTRTIFVVSVDDLEDAINRGNELLEDNDGTNNSEELDDLLNQLEEAILVGDSIIEDLESDQETVDEQTQIINDLIDQIMNLEFTVTFYYLEGDIIGEPQEVKYMESAVAPEDPTKVGYNFGGWEPSFENVTNNLDVYAKWEAKDDIEVSFETNYDQIATPESIEVTYDEYYGELPELEGRIGYTFEGWYLDSELTNKVLSDTKVLDENDHTLYAKWEAKDDIEVSFETNYDQIATPESIEVTYDEYYGELPELEGRVGYTFEGWYLDSELTNKVLSDTKVSDENDHTLYAKWKAKEYTLTLDPLGGTVSSTSLTVTFGQEYGELPTPIKTGYEFDGWYTAVTGGSEITPDSIVSVTSNHTLFARWSPNSYEVTFDPNGGSTPSFETKDVLFHTAYGELPETSREGYDFVGWFTSQEGGVMISSSTTVTTAEGHTLYARWDKEPVVLNDLRISIDPIRYLVGDDMGQITVQAYYSDGSTVTLSEGDYTFIKEFSSAEIGTFELIVEYNGLTAKTEYDVFRAQGNHSGFIILTRITNGINVKFYPHSTFNEQQDNVYHVYSTTILTESEILAKIADIDNDDDVNIVTMTKVGSGNNQHFQGSISTNEIGYHYVWATDPSTHTRGYELLTIIN